RHPLHLAHEIAEHLLSLQRIRRLTALEELEVGAQAGERRSQLVRGVGDQLTLRAQRGFQLAEHGVEARAQTAQLVATVRRHAPRLWIGTTSTRRRTSCACAVALKAG